VTSESRNAGSSSAERASGFQALDVVDRGFGVCGFATHHIHDDLARVAPFHVVGLDGRQDGKPELREIRGVEHLLEQVAQVRGSIPPWACANFICSCGCGAVAISALTSARLSGAPFSPDPR
jgi:hypothetical protein